MLTQYIKTKEYDDFFTRCFSVSTVAPKPLYNPEGLDFFSVGTAVESNLTNQYNYRTKRVFSHKPSILRGLEQIKYVGDMAHSLFAQTADNCLEQFNLFCQTGQTTNDYIIALFKYCYLEDISRRMGKYREEDAAIAHMNKTPSKSDISILKEADVASFVISHLKEDRNWCFGQCYGYIGKYIGGADSDISIGDTLYEVKTVKSIDVKSSMKQLVGYFLCFLFEDNMNYIKRLAIYSTRHNVEIKFLIKDIIRDGITPSEVIDGFLRSLFSTEYEGYVEDSVRTAAIEKLANLM